MAATGLLGINPYQKGVALDISSKPTQFAIQEIQHQKAQAEAIDKYYKDYERSLNSAGLTPEEQQIFGKKLQDVKGFVIKNKEQINNPSKYGYGAQSAADAGWKNLANYIGEGKQAYVKRADLKKVHDKAILEGKHISKNYMDVWNNAMKPVGGGYVDPSTQQIEIFDPHDERKFEQSIMTGIKPAIIESDVKIYDPITKQDTGTIKKVKNAILSNSDAKKLAENSVAEYVTKRGTREEFDNLFEDKKLVDSLNKRFGEVYKYNDPITGVEVIPKIESIKDFARAKGLSKVDETQLVSEGTPELSDEGKFNYWLRQEKIRAKNNTSANSQFAKELATKMGQNILESTLEDMRAYDEKGNRLKFADNPKVAKLNVTEDILKPYIKTKDVYLGIGNKITKKKATSVDIIPVIGEEGEKLYLAYPILDDDGQPTGKYDWKNKQTITNQLKSKIIGATESNPRAASIIGAGMVAPNKLIRQ